MTYEDDDIEERVCYQSVCAMDAHASHFTCGVKPIYYGLLSIFYV